jgi:hypothetical protein
MTEFIVVKWLSETRKWLTLAPNDWAKMKNNKDAWVAVRGVGRLRTREGIRLTRAHRLRPARGAYGADPLGCARATSVLRGSSCGLVGAVG